jgi:signal transduction histidine kinase
MPAAPMASAEALLDGRLAQLAVALSQGLLLCRAGQLSWANDRLLEIAGRPAIEGLALDQLFEDTGSGLPGVDDALGLECALLRPGGERRTVLCRCAWPERDAEPGAWLVEDVARARRLESELLQAGQELAKLHRELATLRERLRSERAEREELLAVVSHELRTPLTIIGGYSRLLLSEEAGALNPEQRRFLQESRKGCERLDRFIGNLLAASRASKGDEVLELCHASLAPVIDSVLEMFRPMLEEHALALDLDLDRDACCARFDRMRVEQILTNLVGNAIRYAPRGGHIGVHVRPLETARATSTQRFLEIAVTDDGPGIQPADRERIFRPYVQAGDESRAGGLGLGLAICKRLVKAHGGAIGVDERAGGGSRFYFTLPCEEPATRLMGVREG